MSMIVAGRFETFDAAEHASRQLAACRVRQDDCSIFFVSPRGQHAVYPLGGDQAADPAAEHAHIGAYLGAGGAALAGAVVGGGIAFALQGAVLAVIIAALVGAYIGSMAGAFLRMRSGHRRRAPGRETSIRRGGVLLAVRVEPENERDVAQTLRTQGGADVEQAEGQWRDGSWVDFDPVRPPVLSDKVQPDREGAVV